MSQDVASTQKNVMIVVVIVLPKNIFDFGLVNTKYLIKYLFVKTVECLCLKSEINY